jgi:hypothetical protein
MGDSGKFEWAEFKCEIKNLKIKDLCTNTMIFIFAGIQYATRKVQKTQKGLELNVQSRHTVCCWWC